MATSPMMPGAEPPETEMDDAGEAEICIKVAPDGTLSVYMEPGGPEQPAADIGQALKLALEMYRGLDKADASAQEQFSAGFGQQTQARSAGGY